MSNSKTEKEMEEKEEICLRSEEVQEIMGRVPSWIERWGITAIGIMLAVVLVGAAYFPYPDTLTGSFTYIPADRVTGMQQEGYALLHVQGIGKVKQGQMVKVRLANYPYSEFGYLTGEVQTIASFPDNAGLYRVTVSFTHGMKTSNGFVIPIHTQLEGTVEIIVAEKRLIEKLRFL